MPQELKIREVGVTFINQILIVFYPPASYICKIKDSTVLSNNLRYNQYYEKDESSSIDNSAYFDDLL